ncbi:hypothetical protein THERMOS_1857 [Bathymodiolus thermophilus thioautotrophic gill symbiont]|uniref:Uncharacterized protein n=1 Tax=Bathymodiolus thermophilus thioautotrophic gill symbiont TaxID=2360 RepID=A0A8H9CGA7_9GAMM|nr:hypothetical protein THERMOS_1857 [Bathymodiolus thermophilus thioautotrophic gill symbiont]
MKSSGTSFPYSPPHRRLRNKVVTGHKDKDLFTATQAA